MEDDQKKPTTLPGMEDEVTEIDIAPTTNISTTSDDSEIDDLPTTLPEDDEPDSSATNNAGDEDSVPSTWIEIVEGKFKCSECENEIEPETNTIEGTVTADLEQIKADLKQYPSKVIYATCSVCGMEFVFRLKDEKLYLEPSDLEK